MSTTPTISSGVGAESESTRRRRLIAYGRWNPAEHVDPAAARGHIQQLREDYALPLEAVAHLAGIPTNQVVALSYPDYHEYRSWISSRTERSILSAEFDLDALPSTARVSSVGTTRRIQALAVMGWGLKELSERLGVSQQAIQRSSRTPTVSVEKVRALDVLYQELSVRSGPSDRARNQARRAGWVSPVDWEENIDALSSRPSDAQTPPQPSVDNTAVSIVLQGRRTGIQLNRAERTELVRRAAAKGLTDAETANLLDVSPRSILRERQRHDIAAGKTATWAERSNVGDYGRLSPSRTGRLQESQATARRQQRGQQRGGSRYVEQTRGQAGP